ncbi:hypothetical protein L6164_023349 [Bauhinia variegata]|uniref:Uncharacterized protein n=1 Tax=Bauhinia variegata TaxID=167791 RepID=A0ACB9MID2_BAUVA|nr:hypothetical protein L6164_023349 [Bauhinia variegata]
MLLNCISNLIFSIRRPENSVSMDSTTSITSSHTNPSISFEIFPENVKIEIFRRLPLEDLSRVMWISKPCYHLVLSSLLPKIVAPFRRRFDTLLLQLEIDEIRSAITPRVMTVFAGPNDAHYNDLLRQLDWCYKVMQCRNIDGGEKLVDYCNGLFLFCHKGGNPETLFPRLYYYYVINPVTKQCLAVTKPDAGRDIYTNAALAYHPSESSFFSIVQYRGTDAIKVFSSKIGEWVSLEFQLPQHVTRATWEMKSVYCQGAVFRLSDSGHLLKFLVDYHEYNEDQAKAIELPEECQVLNANLCVGVRDQQIIVALSREDSIRIWGEVIVNLWLCILSLKIWCSCLNVT